MHLSSLQVCVAVLSLAAAACSPPPSRPAHHITRRSFFNLQCKGVFDAAIFARLDRVCDDCYNLFREPELYTLCRDGCFTTEYFKGCVEVLQEQENLDQFKKSKCFTSPYFKGCMESLYLYDEEEQLDQMIDFIGKR
ncbi:CHH-like protein isoform X2 [Aricia agestis]|uniref:CHH-like protein isoform X2 n=1 Tax=Aricia agestis TaxID=91739 RepID=UPI001C20637D|nr:CHH-like protein isoform X2 [Aricia agestis]